MQDSSRPIEPPRELPPSDSSRVANEPRTRRPRRAWLGLCLVVVTLLTIWIIRTRFIRASAGEPDPAHATRATPSPSPTAATPGGGVKPATTSDGLDDESIRANIVGPWTRQYYGTWNLEIRDGGTGTMTVLPDRFWSLVVGPRVTIRMEWRVEEGHAIFDSIDGEPKSSFDKAMTFWKQHQERKVVELNGERFVYKSDDGKSNSVWTRAEKE